MELLQRLDPQRRAIVPVLLLVFLATAARHASAASIDLPRRPDEKAPEKPPTASVFGRPLWISGDVQARDRYKKNFDLDDATRANSSCASNGGSIRSSARRSGDGSVARGKP